MTQILKGPKNLENVSVGDMQVRESASWRMCKFGNSPLGDVPLGTYASWGMDSKNLTFEQTISASFFLYDINDLMVKIKLVP